MNAIITVVGKDKVGIMAGVCVVLQKINVNILDISQTLMQEYFTMIMLVDLSECTLPFDELAAQLMAKGEERSLSVNIQRQDIFDSMHRI